VVVVVVVVLVVGLSCSVEAAVGWSRCEIFVVDVVVVVLLVVLVVVMVIVVAMRPSSPISGGRCDSDTGW